MSEVSDPTLQLVLRARRGDEAAYERLFALAYEGLRLYVRLRLGRALRGKLESDDVVQDTYLHALDAFERFRWQGASSFSRWLCRIAENRIRALADHHGAQKRRPPEAIARASQVLERVAAQSASLVTRVAQKHAAAQTLEHLDRLPDDLRRVLLLRFFAGMGLDEIAGLTGTARSTVRRQLGRATLQLGEQMAGAA